MRHKQEYGIVVNLRRIFFFFSSRRRHTRYWRDWSSDVCSSDLEGICGSCPLMINGVAHGPMPGTATCQLHMRGFRDGDTIEIGRAACRERVYIWVVGALLKKKKTKVYNTMMCASQTDEESSCAT